MSEAPAGHNSPRWAKVLDQTSCIGCHACTTACKSENEVPLGVTRTYVKSADVGTFPQARRSFQVTRCNQCEDAPCVTACPTSGDEDESLTPRALNSKRTGVASRASRPTRRTASMSC